MHLKNVYNRQTLHIQQRFIQSTYFTNYKHSYNIPTSQTLNLVSYNHQGSIDDLQCFSTIFLLSRLNVFINYLTLVFKNMLVVLNYSVLFVISNFFSSIIKLQYQITSKCLSITVFTQKKNVFDFKY